MRFFIQELYDSWYNDADEPTYLKLAQEYQQHIDSLRGVLSDDLIELAKMPGIDDGLIVELHRIHASAQIVFVLRGGNLQIGYYDLVLTYTDASMSSDHGQLLRRLANAHYGGSPYGPRTGNMRRQTRKSRQYLGHTPDLYWFQIDITEDGAIEHRFLFHPGYWFAIRCKSLHWERIERPDREFVLRTNCF